MDPLQKGDTVIQEIGKRIKVLLQGQIPAKLDLGPLPSGENHDLAEMVNQLIECMSEIQNFIFPLSQGILKEIAIQPKNFLGSPFKELHSHLVHLTWQTGRIAQGDYHQKVDFMGEFSEAFNSMVISLEQKERALTEKISQLEPAILQIKQAEEQIRTSLEEKEVLLKEIHHRVKNNLQIVNGLLKMQFKNIQDPQIREMVQDCQKRINSMSIVHEFLYRSENLAKINLHDYLRQLGNNIIRTFDFRTAIKLDYDLEPVQTSIDAAIPCGLIVTELLTNAFKYAFQDMQTGEVIVSLKNKAAGELVLTVKDNGAGIPADFDLLNAESLGLKLVTGLAQYQLKGRIAVNRDQGTEFQITFTDPHP